MVKKKYTSILLMFAICSLIWDSNLDKRTTIKPNHKECNTINCCLLVSSFMVRLFFLETRMVENNQIIVKQFENDNVRIIDINGNPWFVAKDICMVLGIKNPSDSLKTLDEEERARFNLGRQGKTNIINESGLYNFVLQSRKPEAKKFKKWVTSEVLPSIRKTGEYSISNPPKLPDFNDPVAAARAWADAKEAELKAKLELKEAQPKIAVHDHIEVSINSIPVAQMANLLTKKGFKIGQNNLFKWFYDQKYLKNSDRPYQKYLDAGLFEVRKVTYMDNDDKERTAHKVMITGKGQAYFMKKLIPKQDNEQIQIPL
jgi:anti-repressor protein